MEDDDFEDDDVKGEEEDDVGNDDAEEEEEDDTEDADAEEEDRSQDRAACFVRACAVEMHFNISQEPFYTEIYRKHAAAQNLGPHFAQAYAVEMHFNISQKPLYTEIYRKNSRAQSEHPDQAPAFTLAVRTPQCGHTVWETWREWKGQSVGTTLQGGCTRRTSLPLLP